MSVPKELERRVPRRLQPRLFILATYSRPSPLHPSRTMITIPVSVQFDARIVGVNILSAPIQQTVPRLRRRLHPRLAHPRLLHPKVERIALEKDGPRRRIHLERRLDPSLTLLQPVRRRIRMRLTLRLQVHPQLRL